MVASFRGRERIAARYLQNPLSPYHLYIPLYPTEYTVLDYTLLYYSVLYFNVLHWLV